MNHRPGPRNVPIGGSGGGIDGRLPNRNPMNNREQSSRVVRPHGPVERGRPLMERPAMVVKGRPPGPMYRAKGPVESININERSSGKYNVDGRQDVRMEKYSRSFPPSAEVLVSHAEASGVNRSHVGSRYNAENGILLDSAARRSDSHTEEAREDSSEGDVEESGVFEDEFGSNQDGKSGASGPENALANQMVDALTLSDGAAGTSAVKQAKTSRGKVRSLSCH